MVSLETVEARAQEEVTGGTYRGPGGVVVHLEELGDLYNLLEDNPAEWNHRLRVVIAGMLLHYVRIGKIKGSFQ